jgi:hypothetical protein
VANEIGGDDLLIGVLYDVLVLSLGSSLNGGLDFVVGSLLLEADDEVNDGDIKGRDTEGKAAVDRGLPRSAETR